MTYPTKYEYKGMKGLQAIADYMGVSVFTLKNRLFTQKMTLEQAVKMGVPSNKQTRKNAGPAAKADCAEFKFIKRGNRKRLAPTPNYSELQKLALGIQSNTAAY